MNYEFIMPPVIVKWQAPRTDNISKIVDLLKRILVKLAIGIFIAFSVFVTGFSPSMKYLIFENFPKVLHGKDNYVISKRLQRFIHREYRKCEYLTQNIEFWLFSPTFTLAPKFQSVLRHIDHGHGKTTWKIYHVWWLSESSMWKKAN